MTFQCASAAPYTITNLGPLSQAYTLRINDYGQVVGTDIGEHPVVWQPASHNATTGAFSLLPIAPGSFGYATDINAMGQITGYGASSAGASVPSRPFLFTPTATNSTSGTVVLLAYTPFTSGQAAFAGINDFGEVVFNNGPNSHAALFVPTGPNQSIGTVTDMAAGFYQAVAINNAGQFIGNNAGYESTYQMARFEPVTPRSTTGAVILVSDANQDGALFRGPGSGYDFNVSGVVVGYGSKHDEAGTPSHALLWYPNGYVTDVNAVGAMTNASLYGINDHGIAVGKNIGAGKAFVFDANSNTFTYLETLVSGWTFQEATGVNNFGQVVGVGTFNGTSTAFLLTPIQSGSTGRSSANYTISPETRDHGGRRTTSASYTNDGSIGTVAGISTVASPAETIKAGYVAQLTDVTGLLVNPVTSSVNENGLLQLQAFQLLDDSTKLSIDATLVSWSLVSGPVVGVSVAGVATAGIVYQNSPATVQGTLAPYTASMNFTVLDSIADNFGTYAGDGLGDDWQVQYFGLPPNANAGPLMDPDGDGQTNAFECTAGLVPTDPASRFVLSIAPVPGQPAQKKLIFSPRFVGRNYVVKFKSDLTGGTWSTLPSSTFTDNGQERTVTDLSATGAKKFYQVEITKP